MYSSKQPNDPEAQTLDFIKKNVQLISKTKTRLASFESELKLAAVQKLRTIGSCREFKGRCEGFKLELSTLRNEMVLKQEVPVCMWGWLTDCTSKTTPGLPPR